MTEGNDITLAELEQHLGEKPADADLLDAAGRVARRDKAFGRLADLLANAVPAASPAQKLELCLKLADLYEEDIGYPEEAAHWRLQALELNPRDAALAGALADRFTATEEWEKLAGLYRVLLAVADDTGLRVELLGRIATIARERTHDVQAELAAYREILDHDPGHADTLERLDRALTANQDWQGLVALLDQKLKLSSNADEAIACFLQKGDVLWQRLGSAAGAEEQYRSALELAPGHQAAMDRLADLLLASGGPERMMDLFLSRVRQSEDGCEQARLLTRMAECARDRLNDSDGAAGLFEAALQRIPDHPSAVGSLTLLYLQQEKWAKALPLLELQLAAARAGAVPGQEAAILTRMGEALQRLGRTQDALVRYRAAYDKGAVAPAVLRALGELNLAQGNHAVASTYYGRYLDGLSGAERAAEGARGLCTMGMIQRALGNHESARDWFAQALQQAPDDVEALAALVELLDADGDWATANEHRGRLAEAQTEPLQRIQTCIAIGDTCCTRLNDPEGGKAAYEDAAALAPGVKAPLLKLLEMHMRSGDNREAVTVLERLMSVETDIARKVSLGFTRATLLHNQLKDPQGASAAYAQTLELDPGHVGALKALLQLRAEGEQWNELESDYRALLGNLAGRDRRDLEYVAHRGLGELYELHLARPEDAVIAYEAAIRLRPDDQDMRGTLARLCESAGRVAEAVTQVRALIQLAPQEASSYRRLARNCDALGRRDDAWFGLSALAARGQATDRELKWLKTFSPAAPRGTLTREQWLDLLLSRAQNLDLGELFALLAETLGDSLPSKSPKEAGLRKRDRVDAKGNAAFSQTLARVAGTLGLPVPEVYRTDRSQGLDVLPTRPPVLLVAETLLAGADPGVLAFLLGRTLTWLHPWHVLALYFPTDALKSLLAAAVAYVRPTSGELIVEDPELAELHRQLFQRLGKEGEAIIERVAPRLAGTSVSRWMSGVELTSNHAGLLVCMDVGAALAALRSGPVNRSRLPVSDQADELAVFATSKEFAALRDPQPAG